MYNKTYPSRLCRPNIVIGHWGSIPTRILIPFLLPIAKMAEFEKLFGKIKVQTLTYRPTVCLVSVAPVVASYYVDYFPIDPSDPNRVHRHPHRMVVRVDPMHRLVLDLARMVVLEVVLFRIRITRKLEGIES